MQENAVGRAKVVYVSRGKILACRGDRILESRNGGETWQCVGIIPTSYLDRSIMSSKLMCRLFRKGVHHITIGDSCALILANKSVYALRKDQIALLGKVHGSRPLALCAANDTFYYGEYQSNLERLPVHVWKMGEDNLHWQVAWRFTGTRHVHGVFHDPYDNSIWVTTGDLNHEAGIWRTDDDFKTLHKIAGGTQQTRSIQLLFTQQHVYFGSDTPGEENHIYRMDKNGRSIEQLSAVGSSVFYGCMVRECLFFSTAVEPSNVNSTRYAEIWGSVDGKEWNIIRRFKKDVWPIRYFQYGQVLFPSGPGDEKNLWFTPMGVEHDQNSFRVPLNTCMSSTSATHSHGAFRAQ